MSNLKIQSVVFNLVALLAVLWSLFSKASSTQILFLPLILAILLLGVPHGSFDTMYATLIFKLKSKLEWACFVLVYLLLILSVVTVYRLMPLFFLGSFLLISILHFSEDFKKEASFLTRFFYGGAIIILPFLMHSEEVFRIFSLLVPNFNGHGFQVSLKILGWFWLAGASLATLQCFYQKKYLIGVTLACLTLLFTFCDPLLAFSVYFCVMHSPRHLLRTFEVGRVYSKTRFFTLGLVPTFFVLAAFAMIQSKWASAQWDDRVLPIVFISLAALTVPHMILLKKAESLNK